MPSFLESDIKVFILTNLSKGLSNGRQVARIFHGIQSPRFSAKNWSKNPMWGRHIYYPFDMIRQIAQESMDDISQQSLACIPDE